MSYNRGYGQGGTPYRSNLTQNLGQRNMVSPWECGVAPNSRGQMQNNILPLVQQTHSPVNSNVLAQQHALAVASNLLSTLGMLPQPQQHHQELPSLLNLSGLGNNSLQFRNQQQNFGRIALNNRFNNNVGSVRRKQDQGNYRSEPYNKNRGRQSHVQQSSSQPYQQGRTRYNPMSKTQPDRKPAAAPLRANVKTPASSKGLPDLRLKLQKPSNDEGESEDSAENGKNDDDDEEEEDGDADAKDPVKSSEKQVDETQPGSDIAVDEEAKRDDEEDDGGKKKNKRDWKDEKKIDIIDVDNDAKSEEVKEESKESVVSGKAEKDEAAKPAGAVKQKKVQKNADKSFNCHVCRQSSQGELAFVKHLNSKTHKISMENLSARYVKEADNMRRNMQNAVRSKELLLQRQNKMPRNVVRDYCKMCDLRFIGHLPAHRRDEKHLKLKTFLHPHCRTCDKEFPTRLEWDNHRLSILHQLRALVKPENIEDDESVIGKKSVLESAVPLNSESEVAADQEDVAMDVEVQYDPTQCYGVELIVPGFHCKACEVFVRRKRDHCKLKTHFNNFLLYKEKEKEAADLAQKTTEAEKLALPESAAADPTVASVDVDPLAEEIEPDNKDNKDNWKRPREEVDEDDEDDDSEVVAITPVKKKVPLVHLVETPLVAVQDGNAPYDPLEADSESLNESSKDVPDPDDPILEDLDDAINEILVSAEKGKVATGEHQEAVTTRGPKARRGRGAGNRGKKRK